MSGAGTAHDWVSRMADELIAAADARDGAGGRGVGQRPIVCASGLSPSGPIHLGNLREVMTPHLVADEIRRRGRTVDHLLSWDDYDRFRKVPLGVEGVDESWAEHIGRPLSSVPAPRGSTHPNWAAHFRTAMAASLAELGVEFRGISQTQMYTSGAYRDSILRAMRERATIAKVLERYRTKKSAVDAAAEPQLSTEERAAAEGSGAAEESDGTWWSSGDYYPYRPYCAVCDRDTTTVIGYDDATTLTYACECGHEATMDLSWENHGKLVWKVDWPMRWAFEGVEFEPSGVDHSSPGSSYVVGGQIVGPVFGGWQPIGPMYAFVGIAGMAKMSSSTGGVPTPADALDIMEPQVLRWLYARRRPNQSFTVAFNRDIHRLYDEWDALVRKVRAGKGQPADVAMVARSARTAAGELPRTAVPLPYRALCSVADLTGGLDEGDEGDEGRSAQQLRILASMDTGVTSLEDTRPRLDKAARWIATQADPEDRTVLRAEADAALLASLDDHQRQALASLTDGLEVDWSLGGLTALVYGIPKRQAGLDVAEKKLPPEVKADQRAFFALIYRLLLGADTGPRIPTLLLCAGPGRVRHLLGA